MSRVDRIDTMPDGTLQIRFIKDNGGYHRTTIPPSVNPDAQMDFVDDHLQRMGQTAVSVADRTVIRTRHPRGGTRS